MTKGVVSEQEQQRYRLTLEALVDVDTGKTIDHNRVEQWVESLDESRPHDA